MKGKDYAFLGVLGLLALFVWLRERSWMSSAADTLPILVALPVFFWLGRPWNILADSPFRLSTQAVVVSVVMFLIGIVSESTLLMAMGWTLLLWSWLKVRTPLQNHSDISKLLILPLMSFPWITLDMQTLGWYFRLSGAWVTAKFFDLLGFSVVWEGTTIMINKVPISVEAACAGLNTLQSMLIAGSVVAFIILGRTNRYWPNLLVLIVMAWFANTLRIIAISSVALAFGREAALGTFHEWGGWFILVLMFIMCWFLFELQVPKTAPKPRT